MDEISEQMYGINAIITPPPPIYPGHLCPPLNLIHS